MPNPRIEANGIQSVIQGIREAWQSGRRIVPVVGAGLSADSGIPVIRSILRYFCKFQQYIQHRAYLPLPKGKAIDPLERFAVRFRTEPWRYVAQLGWPDRFDLNQDLLAVLETEAEGEAPVETRPLVAAAVRTAYEAILKDMNPEAVKALDDLRKAVLDKLPKRDIKGTATAPAPETQGTQPPQQSDPVADPTVVGQRFIEDDYGGYVPFQLFGDWRKVIQYFTHYQGEYADVLFHRLCGGRRPSQGHRFLAFLIKLLAVRTVFTFNFDDLIERSLRTEGVDHLAFAMEQGSHLPHPALVQDVTAVVKMHGGTHALLLDERLDRPLTDEYKQRFLELVGPNPLLLVLGCSGGDNRLRDLLDHTARYARGGAEVAWVHFEETEPAFLTKFRTSIEQVNRERAARKVDERSVLLTTMTNNVGLTLQHIHTSLVGRHPASPLPYVAHVNRPLRLGCLPFQILAEVGPTEKHQFVVLDQSGAGAADLDEYPVRTAAEALVDLSAHWTRWGWQPIWVDLESVHTLAAVVGSILDQCRAVDATLTPSVLPVIDQLSNNGDQPQDPVHQAQCALLVTDQKRATQVALTAVRRVVEALRRSRYIVLFDGLEAYLWPPTTHHGETLAGKEVSAHRLHQLLLFLLALSETKPSIGESKVVISVDQSKARSHTSAGSTSPQLPSTQTKYTQFVDSLCSDNVWYRHEIGSLPHQPRIRFDATFQSPVSETETDRCLPVLTLNPNGKHYSDLKALLSSSPKAPDKSEPRDPAQVWGIALLMMSTVRRPRHLVTARHLLRPVFGRGEDVDVILEQMTSGELGKALGMTRLEGGGVWYHRPVRDYVYNENSRYTETESITKCLLDSDSSASPAQFRMSAAQAFVLAIAHQRVARLYYTYTFFQSDDAITFLEYTYHRISSIRYFAKVLALLERQGASTKYHGCATGGVGDALRAFRKGLSESGWQRLWRGIETEGALVGVLNSDLQSVTLDDCRRGIQKQQERDISSLTRAWVRAEPVLRTQLPAEQLICWSETLLHDDIPRRMNSVVVRTKQERDVVFPSDPRGINPEAREHVLAFAEVIIDFTTKLKFERADFHGAAADRWAILKADRDRSNRHASSPLHRWESVTRPPDLMLSHPGAPLQVKQFLDLIPEENRDWLRLAHLHYLLDTVACFIKRSQERGLPCDEIIPLLDVVQERLTKIDNFSGGLDAVVQTYEWTPDKTAAYGDYHEAWMRYYYLYAEAQLQDVSVFSQSIGFLGRPLGEVKGLKERRIRMKKAADLIEQGLTSLRALTQRADGRLRSLILDPTSGGSLYVPYRAAFYSLHGRLTWFRAVRDDTISATPGLLNDEFETAFQSFDLSLAGLRNSNHQIAAQTELYRVEACLVRARVALYPMSEGPDVPTAIKQTLDHATAKYESARTALQRARTHLQTGRRNVIWWKLFYALAAQYHADRLTTATTHLLRDWPRSPEAPDRYLSGVVKPGEAVSRLRRGYAAVRSGLDFRDPSPGGEANWPWLRRVWREMTLAGYVIGRMMLRHLVRINPNEFGEYASPDAQHKYICHMLEWLNRSARLLGAEEEARSNTPESEIRTVLSCQDSEPSIDWARNQLDKIIPENEAAPLPPTGLTALTFRKDLLYHSQNKSQSSL